MKIDFADLATIVSALISAPGESVVTKSGDQAWSSQINGVPLRVHFSNHTDRWEIASDQWTVAFRFDPVPPGMNVNEDAKTWFGAHGEASECQIWGDIDLLKKHLTMTKVTLKPIPDQIHTYMDFAVATIVP